MKVTFSDKIGSTPAIVRRDTGEIFLNSKVWFTLPEAYRRFILAHEIGHYTLQTTNELEADHYAFNQIAGTRPESLKNTVRTLYGVLPFNTELQALRLQNMYRLALTYDQYKKPTAARQIEIRRIETDILNNYSQNQQLQQYIMNQKGKTTDYEFRGYDPSIFNPSIGQRFHDIPINGPAATNTADWQQQKPWQVTKPDFVPIVAQNAGLSPTAADSKIQTAVPLDLLPEYKLPFSLDLKSLAIGVLVILVILGLKNL